MNVFEDLIEELRDENLLEETVAAGAHPAAGVSRSRVDAAPILTNGDANGDRSLGFEVPDGEGDRDFYRKRAMDEISSLQMVEHVLSGIEREHMKVVSAAYDDLEAKKSLHKFLQIQGDLTTAEYVDAEFKLMRETEAWSTALSKRDQKITVSNLRRFCENSQPALSSQALIALGRFYRNASYSELARSKFEFVMTRLFSREGDDHKRRMLFGRFDMIGHIKTLYANWSSIALYSSEDASVTTRAVVAGFEDRVAEAERAERFEQLIRDRFFDKVHEFKEATGETFYTPEIVAAVIDGNVRIGNKFVDLIRIEREETTPESVEQKYGYEYDQIVSEAAAKTLKLVELLKSLPTRKDGKYSDRVPVREVSLQVDRRRKEGNGFFTIDLFGVNKWLLTATIVIALASGGLYFWTNQPEAKSSLADTATNINLDTPELREYLRAGRGTSETLYATTLPAWDQVDAAKRKQVLQKALDLANQSGLKKVQLVNVRGRSVAYASSTKFEVVDPAP